MLGASGTGQMAVDLLVLLATAGMVAILLGRLRVATVAGYLVAGALIGPHALGLVGEGESIESIRVLATILLMFTIGMHLDVSGMQRGLVSILVVGAVTTFLVAVLGWPVVRLFGGSWSGALAISMALSMSSTAVVMRMLEQRKELQRVRGRLIFGVLLVQDLVVLVVLAMLPLLAIWGTGAVGAVEADDSSFRGPWRVIGQEALAIGGITLMILIGRYTLPRLLQEAARDSSGEVLLVVSAAIALGAAVFSAWLKFSPELGAFLAGFLLAGTPFRYQLAGQMIPMRDLFMAVFFTAVGLQLPIDIVLSDWWVIALGVGALVALKATVIMLVMWGAGISGPVAVYGALALAQGGEFSLVVLAQARAVGVISDEGFGYTVATIVVSLMVTPALFKLAELLSGPSARLRPPRWIRAPRLTPEPEDPPSDPGTELPPEPNGRSRAEVGRAIVAGFGPVGRAVHDMLERRGVAVTVIDLNPRTVRRQTDLGRRIVFGDASNSDVLESAGLSRADAVILTMPDEPATLQACRVIRALRPDVFVAARANVLSKALQAMQLGADHVVVEELAAAEAMASQVLQKIEDLTAGRGTGRKLYRPASPPSA